MKLQNLFAPALLLACLKLSSIYCFAQEIPTLDFSKGHEYSLLEKAGISVTTRNQKSSQSILNKKFNLSLGKEKTISIGSQGHEAVNGWAAVWCPPGETNLQFIALGTGYLTAEETRKLMEQIRTALGWGEDDFEKSINPPTSFHKWVKVNKTQSPYYAVEVGTTYLKETPFFIKLTIAWDANIIEKEFPDPDRWRQELLQHFKQQSNSTPSSAH